MDVAGTEVICAHVIHKSLHVELNWHANLRTVGLRYLHTLNFLCKMNHWSITGRPLGAVSLRRSSSFSVQRLVV